MKNYFYLFVLFIIPILGWSQEDGLHVYSLHEAIDYAKIHNYDYINAQTDIEIAEKKVWETTAIGLPQVDGAISNENYIDIPVTLMPDFISPSVYGVNINNFGLTPTSPLPEEAQFFPVQFGTKHNASASVNVNQLLFSGEYIVGLKASKAFLGQTEKQKVQTEVILVEQVSKSYFLILSLSDNLKILDSSLVVNRQLLEETKAMFQAGFVEDTDVDQLDVIVSSLEANIRNIENEKTTAITFLKFYMGLAPESSIELTDRIDDVMNQLDIDYLLGSEFDVNENIDFLLFLQQKELADLQLQRDKSQYLPSLNAFFSAKTNAMRDSYSFFDSSLPWFPTTVWGFQMSIPIFSSGKRSAVVSQSKLNLKKLEESQKQLSTSLQLQVQTARNNFSNKYYEYLNRKKNLELTVRIYQKTQIKYKGGMASSFDLNQAQNSFIQANTDYTLSIMNLLQNKIELEKFLTKTAALFN
jgi:outer membrane protein TolC